LPEEILQQRFILYKLNPVEQQTLHQLYRARLQYQEQVHHLASHFFELFQKKVSQQNYLYPQQQQFLWKSLQTDSVNDLWTIAIMFLQLQVGVEEIIELLRTGTQVSTALDKHGSEQTVIIISQGARAVLEALRQGHKLSTSLENRAVRLLIHSFTKMDETVKSDPEFLIENLSSLLQNISSLSELNHDQVMKILPKWIAWAEQRFYKYLYNQDTDIFDNSFEDTLAEPWHTYFNAPTRQYIFC
jgi:hypothetical protein